MRYRVVASGAKLASAAVACVIVIALAFEPLGMAAVAVYLALYFEVAVPVCGEGALYTVQSTLGIPHGLPV